MGLRGMARRAGAARGAYMAEMENYHRQRQGMLDQRQAMLDQSLLDFRRQQMGIAAAGERRAQATFDSNQGWLAKERANKEKTWGQEDAKRKDEEAKRKVDLNIAQEKLNAAKNAQARRSEIWGLMSDDEKIAAEYPYSRYAVDGTMGPMGRMGRMGANLNGGNRGNGENGVRGGRAARAVPEKPAVSDAQIKYFLENAAPGQMQEDFDQVYNVSDKEMKRLTGKTREQFFADANSAYKEHVNLMREKALTRPQFLEQYEKRYGFRPIHDLRAYRDAQNVDDREKPTGFGNWMRRYGKYVPGLEPVIPFTGIRPYGMDKYKHENPAIFEKQKQTADDILLGFGGPSTIAIQKIRDPGFVKKFMAARSNGLSPQDAVHSILGYYPNRAAQPVNRQSVNPTTDNSVPRRLPFSSDAELVGFPPLSEYERGLMRRSDRYINWFNQAKDNGYDIDRARRYAEYQYRRGAR